MLRRWTKVPAEESIGVTYNLLTVDSIEYRVRKNGRNQAWANCTCFCGGKHAIWLNSLRQGTTKGCQSCFKNRMVKCKIRHGHTSGNGKCSSEYGIWAAMLERCRNPNCPAWENYGGRGITFDPRWIDFAVFLEDVGTRPGKEYSLDRRDNDQGYNKDNCRWATRTEQNRNTRRNRVIQCNGKSMILQEWAEYLGIDRCTIYRWIKKCDGDEILAVKTLEQKHCGGSI